MLFQNFLDFQKNLHYDTIIHPKQVNYQSTIQALYLQIKIFQKNIFSRTMLPGNVKRLISEMETLKREIEKKQIIYLEILELKEFDHAIFLFSGPIDSPYQGFWFRLKMQWPTNYPFRPPKCTLIDKIWNPYVDYDTNQICMDILADNHSPALKIIDVIVSISSLLSESKVNQTNDGFANPQAAIQMIKNYPYFCQQARKICDISSYKRQQIYSDEMRGLPVEHTIEVETHYLPSLIAEGLESKKFNKKQPQIQCQLQEKIEEEIQASLLLVEEENPSQVSQQNEFPNLLSSEYIEMMNTIKLDEIQGTFNANPETNNLDQEDHGVSEILTKYKKQQRKHNFQSFKQPQPLSQQQFNELVDKHRKKVLQRLDEKDKQNQKEKLAKQASPSSNNM